MGGLGSLPSKIALMNSRPLNAAPSVSALIGSSHVIVRLRGLLRISVIESHRLLQLGGDGFLGRSDSDAPDGESRDRAAKASPTVTSQPLRNAGRNCAPRGVPSTAMRIAIPRASPN